ncbi:hypothetical protein LMG26690_01677 [Achromobacter animicus]|uniref:Uncharacterized protein n=1 Tax=Achromobacter animicus TaxID=1389935 RepID=A0A6S6ZMB7_9BURK|nr:hypothetical protein LMG26690_01677 [Achromobacter animicus]
MNMRAQPAPKPARPKYQPEKGLNFGIIAAFETAASPVMCGVR